MFDTSTKLPFGLEALGVPSAAFILGKTPMFFVSSTIILVTGCVFAMWLGEKITDKGIGNGISILIMVGIIATLPLSFAQELASSSLMLVLIELVIWFVIILLSVLLVMAVRKIRYNTHVELHLVSMRRIYLEQDNLLPLKLKRFWSNAYYLCTSDYVCT